MKLELYESKKDRDFRKMLEKKASKIIELQEAVKNNPDDEGLRNNLNFHIFDMRCTIASYYNGNPNSNFYGQFLQEAGKLTREQKVNGGRSDERIKFEVIKKAIRQGKASADHRHDAKEMD